MAFSENQLKNIIRESTGRALNDQGLSVDRVEVCIVDPADSGACLNVYAVVCVRQSGTSIIRVESSDGGTVYDTYTITDCVCTCTDLSQA